TLHTHISLLLTTYPPRRIAYHLSRDRARTRHPPSPLTLKPDPHHHEPPASHTSESAQLDPEQHHELSTRNRQCLMRHNRPHPRNSQSSNHSSVDLARRR